LVNWLDRLLADRVPAELHLDLLQAATRRGGTEIEQRVQRFEETRRKDDPLAAYRETLTGGDAEAGRRLFFHKTELSCVRCHRLGGEGGEVGPDLTKIGADKKRDYLLEALIEPNRQIAQGFETAVLFLTSGQAVTGIVKGEDAKEIRLITAEGKALTIPRDQIEERQKGQSSMPADLTKHLSKAELRDLVEFLATRR
jgi:quinoprotein glucose dehydrogenase